MILMIDNYDSFTYNLVHYLSELDEEVRVYRNDKITIEEIRGMNPEIIVISPGPKTPSEAGISLEVIRKFYKTIPILGICLGHQSIIQLLGGEVVKSKQPIHGKVETITHKGFGVFKDLKNPINVTRYHSLIARKETLPKELEITSLTKDWEIMGVRHKEFLLEGVQFHPEALLTECGHEMLNNFLKEAKSRRRKLKTIKEVGVGNEES